MPEARQWMLYGATGYTGRLILEEAVRRGHRPLLAGRSGDKLRPLAESSGLEWVAVSLEDPRALRASVAKVSAVLHAAGPFVRTSAPMVDACLAAGAHYLDITGELPVFEAVYARDAEARSRHVSLICGVGFDVVPTDCLARYVADKVDGPSELEISVSVRGKPSAGTARSIVGLWKLAGLVRRDNRLVAEPLAAGVRKIRFAEQEAWAVPVPLADLLSAARTTGAGTITARLAVPPSVARFVRAGPVASVALSLAKRASANAMVARAAEALLQRGVSGAEASRRKQGGTSTHALARTPDGTSAEAWLETIDGYDFTAVASVLAVEEVFARAPSGALTPALAFGANFPLRVPGTRRFDALPA